jgi:hypothetical protein
MINTSRLFPVYQGLAADTAEFFLSPDIAPPTAVDYYQNDPYGREHHLTQFLAVPLEVANYLALCQAPGQVPWNHRDEFMAESLHVRKLALFSKVDGRYQFLFVTADTLDSTNMFVPAVGGVPQNLLSLELRNFGGFSFENADGEQIGKEVFANFKKAGYEPLFRIWLSGSFDRERYSLRLKDGGTKIIGVRNLETGVIIYSAHVPQPIAGLMGSVGETLVSGAKLHQFLK